MMATFVKDTLEQREHTAPNWTGLLNRLHTLLAKHHLDAQEILSTCPKEMVQAYRQRCERPLSLLEQAKLQTLGFVLGSCCIADLSRRSSLDRSREDAMFAEGLHRLWRAGWILPAFPSQQSPVFPELTFAPQSPIEDEKAGSRMLPVAPPSASPSTPFKPPAIILESIKQLTATIKQRTRQAPPPPAVAAPPTPTRPPVRHFEVLWPPSDAGSETVYEPVDINNADVW